jgi:uncharacterized phage protein (TIGR01671 family)
MREIKFRVWIKEESKMIYLDDKNNDVEINFLSNLTSNHETYWEVNTKVSDHLHAHMTQYFDSRNDENVLMQYTGLKDRNGKEIYEGDILNMTYHGSVSIVKPEIKGVVIFERCSFIIEENGISLGKIGRSLEVIGNIYMNPELLESEK